MLERPLKIADFLRYLQHLWQTELQNRLGWIFVELAHHGELRKLPAKSSIGLLDHVRGLHLPDSGARPGAAKERSAAGPVLPQQAGLHFAGGAELVIVRLQK